MTISLDIDPALEERLAARARSSGRSLEVFIRDLLEREAAGSSAIEPRVLSGSEKAAAFRAWARSFPRDLPVLSLESISRENIYKQD